MGLGMSESLGIDSPLRGWAMPKSYSADLRERVIEAVEMGASRHEAADRFEVSVSSAVKWLQRWHESRSAAPKPRGGSVSPLEKCCGAGIGCDCRTSGPDVDGDGCGAAPAAHSNQQECAFAVFRPPRHHPQKKACKRWSGSERTWPVRADAGSGSKACLTPRGWYLSTRLRSAPTWCG